MIQLKGHRISNRFIKRKNEVTVSLFDKFLPYWYRRKIQLRSTYWYSSWRLRTLSDPTEKRFHDIDFVRMALSVPVRKGTYERKYETNYLFTLVRPLYRVFAGAIFRQAISRITPLATAGTILRCYAADEFWFFSFIWNVPNITRRMKYLTNT